MNLVEQYADSPLSVRLLWLLHHMESKNWHQRQDRRHFWEAVADAMDEARALEVEQKQTGGE